MKNKRKILLSIGIIIILTFINISISNANTIDTNNMLSIDDLNKKDYVYLSDIPYMEEKSFTVSDHSIHLDENDSNSLISLKINDISTPFIKGICLWATSEIVYDLSNYDYDYFTSYIGVDISEQSTYFNTGAKFYVYTSNDGENWLEKYQSDTLYGWSEAQFITIDIRDVMYLKLVADDNSDNWWANWYDETIYADAKLIKEGYVEDISIDDNIKTIAEYDEIIKSYDGNPISGDYEKTLLQREFVNNVGYDVLQAYIRYSQESKDTVLWLMNDTKTLRLYLVGGKPEGSYLNSLKVLTKLYTTYKEDLTNETVTQYGTTLGDLYRTMMLSISLTHSGNVYLWIDGVSHSNPITRYEIYKKLHQEELIENKIFESLTVEEMRWVMNTVIDDEEIEWLNDYVRNVKNGATGPYSYITYTFDYNYTLDKYYNLDNYEEWNEKYNLKKYNITYQAGQPKLWIVFEEGAVCGGISKTGSCIWGSYKGLPNTCVSQPGHCAYIYYEQNENGDGIWGLGNDVFGWGQSGRTEHLNVRMMNDWGNGSYTTGWNASYILLAQSAQNEYKKYEEAEEILMLTEVYSDDNEKLEKIYRNALEVEEINFDAWLGLVNLYLNDTEKTEEEYYNLAEEIATNLTYYPRPMYDLITLLQPKLESPEYTVKFTLLRTKILTTAANATSADTIQVTAVKQVANTLLGFYNPNIATFSFDGEDAGIIVLSNQYEGIDVQWEYSFDGGETWTDTGDHKRQLTNEELSSITAENDIKVHVVGVDYSEDNIFTIDIQKAATPTGLYNNDLENKVIGVDTTMEWRMSENEEWTSYKIDSPDLTGNKIVQVRIGNTGTNLASDFVTLSYTEDNQPDTRKYIPVSNLSIYDVSSEEPNHGGGSATSAIDGNINTRWITNWNGEDTDRYITIKLDKPVYLSALEYVPIQGSYVANGTIKDAILYVSIDGENWTEVANVTEWASDTNSKTIELQESILAQYVKLSTPSCYKQNSTATANYTTATMINLFEDITKKVIPTAEIEYDITEKTSKDVTARLVNPSTNITITNNNGNDSYVFKENGEFTFEFVDEEGCIGSVTATVDWIDKIAPTVTVSYNTTEITNQNVTAVITANEKLQEVDGWTLSLDKQKLTKTYSNNKDETVKIKDLCGNETQVEISIQNIIITEENPNEENKIGDINKDSKIDVTDLLLLKRHLVAGSKISWILSDKELKVANINEDKNVDITDLLLLKRLILKNM